MLIASKQGFLTGFSPENKLVDVKNFDLDQLKPEKYTFIYLKEVIYILFIYYIYIYIYINLHIIIKCILQF